MASSSAPQVRPIIECFCQILSVYGFSPITPEIFRLAKFNRNEATLSLWRLIFEILHFDPTRENQQQTFDKFNQTPKDELIDLIKSDLFTRGYTSKPFLSLDTKMQQGSRQLLICLGWLIYHLKLIDNCIKQCLHSDSILDHDDTSSLYLTDQLQHGHYSPPEKELTGQVKQAMRLNSKLRFSLRRLHGLVMENAHLQHQIHQCHNMSSLEAHLCQHPHVLSHYMIEVETEHRKLNLFLFWNEHENVFWKWLESVLDQTMAIEQEEDTGEEEEIYESISQTDRQRLEVEKQKFNAAIDTLDSALLRLEQLWLSNIDQISIERDVTSIDTHISSLFNQLLATDPSVSRKSPSNQSLFLHQPHRLVYAKKSDSIDENRFIKADHFDQETRALTTLQTNIDQHIEKQRIVLDTLSHQFQNVMIV